MKQLIIILLFVSSPVLADNFPERLFGIGIYSGWHTAPTTEFTLHNGIHRFFFVIKDKEKTPYDLDSLGFIKSEYFNDFITIDTNENFHIKSIMGDTEFIYSIDEIDKFKTECLNQRNEVVKILQSKHSNFEFQENYISQSNTHKGVSVSDFLIASDEKKEIQLQLGCQFFSFNSTLKDKMVTRLAIYMTNEIDYDYIPFGKSINEIDFDILTKDSSGL